MDFLSMYEMSPYTLFSAMVSITIAFFISKSFVKYHYYLQNKINNIEYAVHELKLLQVEQLRMLCEDSQDSQDEADEVDDDGEETADEDINSSETEDAEDAEDDENEEETEDDENEEETFKNSNGNKIDIDNVIDFIQSTTPENLEMILQACSDTDNILIPNWFTKSDFENLTGTSLTKSKWLKLTEKSEGLIGHTNAMVVQWFDNISEIIYDNDNDDDDESENNDVFESENDNSPQMLIETDSDEESLNETKESIENQLYQLKVEQLKKMAHISKNMTKSELISNIMKKNSIKNVKKSLSKFV